MTRPTSSSLPASCRVTRWVIAAGLAALSVLGGPALAQSKGDTGSKGSIEKLSGVWVEGPGFDITYGKTYEICAQRCLDTQRCHMIEYYRPEKKCNLYDSLRPRKAGGSSLVGIKH